MSRALDLIARANDDAEPIARYLLGEPNKRLSNARALRWGEHGRLVLNLTGAHSGKWRDWSGVGHGDMLDLVQAEIGGDRRAGLEWLARYYGDELPPIDHAKRDADRRAAALADERERMGRVAYAASLWRQGVMLAGTPAHEYLAGRLCGVPVPLAVLGGGALRWHRGERSMLALMTDPVTGKPGGVHRTFIDERGNKTGRKMIGTKGVVRLWPDEAVTLGLAIGEGIETTISAALLFDAAPAWAALDAGNLACFPPLPGIDALTVFADNDLPDKHGRQAGQEAAQECADQWRQAGREATIRTPRQGASDFNNVLWALTERQAA